MEVLKDVHKRSIRLTAERRLHLEADHPEMAGQLHRIAETLADPDTIARSRTDEAVELFYKHYASTPVTDKFLCAIVKGLPDDHFLITAYYADKIKRGEILWAKK